jgi:glycerol-3-phosphate acyltransferase PlsY
MLPDPPACDDGPVPRENGAVGWILALVPVAYLLGTFPSADLVARRYGVDVTAQGSGNPGASNVVRLLGWRAGALVLLLDAAKGAVAAGAGLAIDGHRGAWILGVAAVVGHVFPVWRRFKGGRGVATGAGVFLVVYPGVTLVLVLVWIAIARGLRKASVASLVVAVLAPAIVIVRGGAAIDIVVVSAVAVLLVVRHASNLRRLIRGEEHGLDRRADEPDDRPRDRPDDSASTA